MFKKSIFVFLRDLKVNTRGFITLYILSFPILFGLVINAISPGINDTTSKFAMMEGDNPAQVEYFEQFADVELYETVADITKRVERRDAFVGIVPEDEGYYIMTQGNEPGYVVEFAKVLKTLYENGLSIDESNAEIIGFGKETPPLKKMLVNISILLSSVLGGMLITINIVEEKADNTISAINVTPISGLGYILGKSAMGLIMPLYGTFALILITGYGGVNILQILLLMLSAAVLSMIIGFLEGLTNDDMVMAVGNFKIVFMPMAGAIAVAEAVSEKWQWVAWWVPYYWTYVGNNAVLTGTSTWGQVLLYTAIVVIMCILLFALLAPKIRAGLEKS
jgi:hypothetical protein